MAEEVGNEHRLLPDDQFCRQFGRRSGKEEVGGGRWEVGGGRRWEVGGRRWEVGGGRWRDEEGCGK